MNPDSCANCRFFFEEEKDGKTKRYCRRRLHSGSVGSYPEMQVAPGMVGKSVMRPTGNRIERNVSFFPQTQPDWWCGEHEIAPEALS